VYCPCAHRGCQAASTSVAVFEFLDSVEEYFHLEPRARKGLDGVVSRMGDYHYAGDSVYGYSVSLVGGDKEVEECEEGGKGKCRGECTVWEPVRMCGGGGNNTFRRAEDEVDVG